MVGSNPGSRLAGASRVFIARRVFAVTEWQGEEGVPPAELVESQLWFGGIIARPLVGDRESQGHGLYGGTLANEASRRVRGHAGMDGLARVQVYNRQYWFRLITIMQADYACTIHVMGLRRYNPWVIRYLETHFPVSPYLNELDKAFYGYMDKAYHEFDRDLVMEALAYDRAFASAFEGDAGQPLEPAALGGSDAMSISLRLAPHATPLLLNHDWHAFRLAVVDDDSLERVVAHPEPKAMSVVIYRDGHTLYEKPVSAPACRILSVLREPCTLPQAFDRLPDLPEEDMAEVEAHLTEWFSDFVTRGWVVMA